MRGCTVVLFASACGFSSQPESPVQDAAPSVDAQELPRDAAVVVDAVEIDARPPPFCAGALHRVCVESAPTATVSLTTQTINTSASSLCAVHTAAPALTACVIVGRTINVPVGAEVTVTGDRPLILLAATITITGTLDASSHSAGTLGPGADSTLCATDFTAPNTGPGPRDGGGGFGGSFGAKGGAGGAGGENGAGGLAASAIPATTLHGGCPGGAGAGTGGAAGRGGGAVALLATEGVTITGVVNASGASGVGGKTSGGGGGGGAGGMIVLDAPLVNVTGQCFANGGGAGEGANTAADGDPGRESPAPAMAGLGGVDGTTVGGNGGAGGLGAMISGAPGAAGTDPGGGAVGGGGGGGGSVGVIKVFSAAPTGTADLAKVSPRPS